MDLNRVWNIANALIALAVCYLLIFEDVNGTRLWLVLGIFFASLAMQKLIRKKATGNDR
jgi:hypothetical protein